MREYGVVVEAWVSTTKSGQLTGRRNKNTQPEMLLRQALHRAGFRFRLHRQLARGCTPDLVLPRYRIAVFVDGCYWHGCPRHGRRTFTGPNAALLEAKMARNRMRDERADRLAVDAGWSVVRVWECHVRADADEAASKVTQVRRGAGARSSDLQ